VEQIGVCQKNDALASDKAVIPEENFAKKGSNCNKAVMTKCFFTDVSMVLHHPAGLICYDFSDCYNRMAHPPISVALQGWGVPKEAVHTMLIALPVMHFFLRTGFGESKQSYGRTLVNPNQGLGQGNGAPPRVRGTKCDHRICLPLNGTRCQAHLRLHGKALHHHYGNVRR